MKITNQLLAGMAGTTAMSLFSYGWSRLNNKQFREPILLSLLLEGKSNKRAKPKIENRLAGWALHYMTGAVFSLGYTDKFLKGKRTAGLRNGTIIGGLDGLAGIAIWKTVLELHPKPPEIDRTNYYAHLLFAHLVFGWFTSRTLLLLEEKK